MTNVPGSDAKSDYSFGQVAIRESLCTFDQVKECLDIQARLRSIGVEPKKMGEILVEKGYLTVDQVALVGRMQGGAGSPRPAPGAPSPAVPAAVFSEIAAPAAVPFNPVKVVIPGYEMISKIGQGAMGSVYKAKQISMDRLVAIKVMAPKYGKDASYVGRFLSEARAVAKLNHENIISGIDVGEAGGVNYFVMEYIDGSPVTKLMKKDGRLDEKRCLQVGYQIARALSHAHKHGIVHRDVKPENIMITNEGMSKLCDLGLAKQASAESGQTMDGMSVGTPNYISPEQARGESNIDIRADIYSLGASLYHMSTGTTPFSGPNPMVVMTKHVTEFCDPPSKRHPAVSEGFSNLVMKMMSKHREDRHQSPDDLMMDIESLQRGGTTDPQAPPGQIVIGRHDAETMMQRRPADHVASGTGRRALAPQQSSSAPVLIAVAAVAVVVIGYFMFAARGGPAPAPLNPGGSAGTRTVVPPPVTAITPPPKDTSEADRVKEEIEAFRSIVNNRITSSNAPDRFTQLYNQIDSRIQDASKNGRFVAQKGWEDERESYVQKVNTLINERVWADVRKRAEEHFNAGRHGKALDELKQLEDVYKWFKRDPQGLKTEAGKAHGELLAKVNDKLTEGYLNGKREADQLFRDPNRRDDAYRSLDALAVSATGEQKAQIEQTRMSYISTELLELLGPSPGTPQYQKGEDRIQQLKALHSGNVDAQSALDRMIADLKDRQARAMAGAASQLGGLYSEFQPKFDAALKLRDIVAVRKALHAICFGNPAALSVLLPSTPDPSVFRAWLDPARSGAFAELKKAYALADEGWRAAQGPGAIEATREVYYGLRMAALLEELLDQALEGAKLSARDPAKFKSYEPPLKDAISGEVPARRAGDGHVINLTIKQGAGNVTVPAHLSPKAATNGVAEEDIVDLARRSYGGAADFSAKADKDPMLALKAFYLFYFSGRMPLAKSMVDKIMAPELRAGLDRYAASFTGVTSGVDEAGAKLLYEQGFELLVKKRDERGGIAKFRECLEKYSATEYMKCKVPPGNKTRIEIVEGLLRLK